MPWRFFGSWPYNVRTLRLRLCLLRLQPRGRLIHFAAPLGRKNLMNAWPLLLAQEDAGGAAGAAGGFLCICFFWLIWLAIVIVAIAGMWKVFEKAGKPGWAAIIPIYNMFVLNEIAGKEILWFILTLIPCVNIVAIIVICMDVAKNFGKDPIYGVGLALLPMIFFPLLGFSDARYQGPAAAPKQF